MNHHRHSSPFILAVLALTVGCERNEPGTDVEEVADHPTEYQGRTVSVVGEVDEVQGPRAFTLESDDDPLEIWEEKVLVVTRSDVNLPGRELEDGESLRVTGEVRDYRVDELERDFDWSLSPGIDPEADRIPVIVANRIARVDEQASWTEGGEPEIVSFTMITVSTPAESLAGSRVSLRSVPVQSVTDKALWIGDSPTRQLLVDLGDHDIDGLSQGDRIEIRGTLREMPEAGDAIERFGLDSSVRDQVAEDPLYLEATELERIPAGSAAAEGREGEDQERAAR